MIVSKQLKKQIMIEVCALLFLVGVIIYALFAIHKSNQAKITSVDGMVIVIDDMKRDKMTKASDGVGLDSNGVTYTLTNNNKEKVNYNIVVLPNIHDDAILEKVRISVDDVYIENLVDLDRLNGGYVLTTSSLDPGYTKIFLFKAWYMLDTVDNVASQDIKFDYKLVKE